MKTVVIIQCRLGSTRLKKKALLDLGGKPLIDHVIERAWLIPRIDKVILNIPSTDVELLGRDCEIYPIEGQEADVLGSYAYIAKAEKADAVVRITGDCPLLAPDASGLVMGRYLCADADYVANVGTVAGESQYTKWADGWDTEVFSTALLRDADQQATSAYDRQHVTSWMRQQASRRTAYVQSPENYAALKCSVDTKEDFDRVQRILAMRPADYGYQATYQAWEWAGKP